MKHTMKQFPKCQFGWVNAFNAHLHGDTNTPKPHRRSTHLSLSPSEQIWRSRFFQWRYVITIEARTQKTGTSEKEEKK